MKSGTLYAVGVGPGDPDLLTIKAAKILGAVDLVFAAASPKNTDSLALSIASPHLRPGVPVERLDFPMTREESVLREAWDSNASRVLEILGKGLSAAFLTLGDPMTYSTFGYLMRTLLEREPRTSIEIAPGITSYQAAAARTRSVLVEADENLCVLSGICPADELTRQLRVADNAVVLKTYRNFEAVREALRRSGRMEDAVLVSRVSQHGEEILEDLESIEGRPPYFSLALVRRPRRS